MKGTLEDHGVFSTRKDIDGLINEFDKNKDGRITYSEFMTQITPQSPVKYWWLSIRLLIYISKILFYWNIKIFSTFYNILNLI